MRNGRALLLFGLAAAGSGLSAAIAAGPDINHGRWVATGGFYEEAGGLACARCHSLDGSGDSSGAFPRLTDQSAWYLYKTLKDFAAGLRPNEVMQQVARQLTDAEMADVSAYYAAIEDAPYPPRPQADQQVVQIGGAIAAIGVPDQGVPACVSCHGDDGLGAPPIYPYLAGQFAPYIEHQLMLWKEGRRDGDPLNIMEFIARNMTDDQIRAVALYFASLRPQEVTPDEELYLTLEETEFAPADRAEQGSDSGGDRGGATDDDGQEAEDADESGQTQDGLQNGTSATQGQGQEGRSQPEEGQPAPGPENGGGRE